MDEWQHATRRYSYLQAMREALPAGVVASAMDKQLAASKAAVERLQKAILDGDGLG